MDDKEFSLSSVQTGPDVPCQYPFLRIVVNATNPSAGHAAG